MQFFLRSMNAFENWLSPENEIVEKIPENQFDDDNDLSEACDPAEYFRCDDGTCLPKVSYFHPTINSTY